MRRKSISLVALSLLLIVFFLQSCQSKPEEGVLKRYFHAVALNDKTTMGSMAMEPIDMDVESWKIVSSSEEIIEPAPLPDLNAKELELKKKVEDSVSITVEAKEDLDDAIFEMENARTRTARRVAQQKVDELQAKYEEIRENHNQVQADYNEAKNAATREESIVNFSLGAGDLPNIRDFTGDFHRKEVVIEVKGKEDIKKYKTSMRRYVLQDEALNMTRRGRWIIVKFEPIE